ncbi:hypothetical protein LptCag_1517 [Leptospirillum ferriphilum]|uniref:Uncharacterized protein n=1 Tax=Leptospirillum ferriphilum TaxID=178606 RepID=A0A094WDU2_9BACT|nr:hypothetical protein LptCag_1517 [Leptospirillum ferriphilum]
MRKVFLSSIFAIVLFSSVSAFADPAKVLSTVQIPAIDPINPQEGYLSSKTIPSAYELTVSKKHVLVLFTDLEKSGFRDCNRKGKVVVRFSGGRCFLSPAGQSDLPYVGWLLRVKKVASPRPGFDTIEVGVRTRNGFHYDAATGWSVNIMHWKSASPFLKSIIRTLETGHPLVVPKPLLVRAPKTDGSTGGWK